MNTLNYRKSHTSNYINKIDDVITWLTSKGLKAHCSRYSRYKSYIDDFYKPEALKELEDRFTKLNEAFQEVVEIVDVYEAFKNENSEGFNKRLKQVVQGKDFYSQADKRDQPRDFLYELHVASRFQTIGYTIDFDQETDVVAKKIGIKLHVECKRIKSHKGLEENFRKAGKQLEKSSTTDSVGFIFIDVYNCIANELKDYEYNSVLDIHNQVDRIVGSYIGKNEKKINMLANKYKDHSLAVCFTMNRCLWLSDVKPQYYKKINVIAPSTITDDNFSKVKLILGELKNY